MPLDSDFVLVLSLCLCLLPAAGLFANPASEQAAGGQQEEQTAEQEALTHTEYVQVTATRVPEPVADQPGAIEVFSAEELAARGATDLRSALAVAAGVDIAPGGDGGPASSVPEFWGLKEFDAFLLVVDGVPWGGAFNPSLATLSLNDVERIEVQRGAAPVMYGATSFVGVIQVVHRDAGSSHGQVAVSGGSFATGGAAFSSSLPDWGGFQSSLAADVRRQGFRDDRTSFLRGHVLWRNSRPMGSGHFRFDVDLTWLDQDPASPHPREGGSLTSSTPIDSNHNPDGAFLNERRFSMNTGYDQPLSGGDWSITFQLAPAEQRIFRGFLTDLSDDPATDNARGIRQNIDTFDFYFDTHWARDFSEKTRLVAGVDHIHGNGEAEGADFDYFSRLSGGTAPQVEEPTLLDLGVRDRRDFTGVYGYTEWNPTERFRLEAGLRLNRTDEEREGEEEGGGMGTPAEAEEAANHQSHVRFSGSAGAAFTAWARGADRLRLVALYKNTFKPAAFDFGLAEGEEGGEGEGLLKPETGASYEAGLKGRWMSARLSFEAMWFLMDFENLVLAQSINGLPSLTNGGKQRFKGIDFAVGYQFQHHVYARGTYGWHDARFTDYLTEFDGVPTQLAGHRLEMSPDYLASAAVVYSPPRGIVANAVINFAGSRYLNKRNTAIADPYQTFSAGVGYRTDRWELRLDGQNLNDTRPPVSESELGDSQYYLLTPRRLEVSATFRF